MFPSKFLQFPSILTHFHAANEKIQNGGRDLAISRGLVWVKPKENTVPVIIGNRKPPSRSKRQGTSQNSSLIQVTQDGTAEDKPGDGHIKVCTVNWKQNWKCGGACAFKQD